MTEENCLMPDIEAYLVEQELTTDLAPAVAKFMDYHGTGTGSCGCQAYDAASEGGE